MTNICDENTRVKNVCDIMESCMYVIESIGNDGGQPAAGFFVKKDICIFRKEYFMYNGEKWCIKEFTSEFTSIDDGSKKSKKNSFMNVHLKKI